MLLSSTIGGLAGLADYNRQVHPIELNARATVAIEVRRRLAQWSLLELKPVVRVSRKKRWFQMISEIDTSSEALVTIRELIMTGTWTAVTLGQPSAWVH